MENVNTVHALSNITTSNQLNELIYVTMIYRSLTDTTPISQMLKKAPKITKF